MLTTIIRGIVRFRLAVWLLIGLGVVVSVYKIRTTALDAIPDISDPQIVVYAKWPRSPQLLETELTEPLIRALVGSPGIQAIRGASHMGYSFIYVILDKSARRDRIQQLVLDRINAIRPQLPADAVVTLGPNASSMGWIYQYALVDKEGTHDLRELRLVNESQIKLALQAVPGVAEVASVGGLEKQYQIKLFPPLLAKSGVTLRQLINSVQGVFQEAGGRTIEVTNREYQLRGGINSEELEKLDFMVIGRTSDGKPVHLRDVGYLQVGYDLRRSTADLDGAGEVVGGIVIMEQGQNVLAVTRALEQKLQQIGASLPQGVDVVTTYDRAAWIWATLRQFVETLAIELAVLILVVFFFLRNVRTAVGPIAILLLSTLFTVLPLALFRQTINLFSLAGLCIAIGEIADATIVIVENCTAELSRHRDASPAERREIVIRSIASVARPLLFSLLIILASFLPVFFLEEREARLFDPLAYSKTFAMVFSTLLTLFLLPIIVLWIFKRETMIPRRDFQESAPVRFYRSALGTAIRYRYAFTIAGLLLLVPAGVLLGRIQRDFMPDVDEGSILYMPTTLPGLPTREAGWVLQQMDRKLKQFPEVARVFGKLGRADTSTDSAPVSMVETTILLQPKSQWRPGMTKDKLIAEMDEAMRIVGYVNTWVQPIRARVMMQGTGLQTPVGIKVKGAEVSMIEDISKQIEGLLRTFPGTKSVLAERISEGYYVDVQQDLERMAEHGVTADEALLTVRYAIGGDNVVGIKQGATVVPLAMQYSPEYTDTLEKVKNTPVITADGRSLPLNAIADVSVRKMPEMVRNDNGDLAGYIYIDLQGGTATDYVERAQRFLAANLTLPPGYALEWTGLFQYAQAARARLQFVVPVTLAIIFVLLMVAFHSVTESVLIMLSVPFAMVGGVFLQRIMGYPMTTAVIVGYISLFAIAVQTGIIMVIFIREALDHRTTDQSYTDAVVAGSTLRLRPKLMTVAATVLSLLPIPLSAGPGMEIMQPIAVPSIGGMVSSTIHVLFMTPCLFVIGEDIRRAWHRRRLARTSAARVQPEL
jgi:Cu(I)/Ag(I) efflux system membrane protein CusA/SilA